MWKVESLQKHHDRSGFDSGEPTLDDWLITKASQWSRKGLSAVFVATNGGPEVLGHYSLSSHYVQFEALPAEQMSGMPPHVAVPSTLLGRLAVTRSSQGTGLGRFLLFDAMRRTLLVTDSLGIAAFEVHAMNPKARQFYLHNGFIPLQDDPEHLFLPMKLIRKLGLPV